MDTPVPGANSDPWLAARVDDAARRREADERWLGPRRGTHDWVVEPGADFGPVGRAKPGPMSAFAALQASLRTGDLLVSRATAMSSAGIGALPVPHSRFSHTSVARRGPDGVVHLVGCFMEQGTVEETLEHFLGRNGTARIVVLRHIDDALAAEAGEAAWRRVREGPFIPYDDDFDHGDSERLFCSEVPAWAFGPLLGRPLTLPARVSTLDHDRSGNLYKALGMRHRSFLAPADYLYDPKLARLAEWRDPGTLAETLVHDAIVRAMIRWIRERGYRLRVGFRDRTLVRFALSLRRAPGLGRLMSGVVGRDTQPDMLKGGLALQRGGAALRGLLGNRLGAELDDEALAERLEALREEDLGRWRRSRRSALFHGVITPGRTS